VLVVTTVHDDDGGTTVWPSLLRLGQQDVGCHDQIAQLWRAALNSSGMHKAARNVLGSWAERVEGHDQPTEALLRLLRVVARDERTAAIVRRLATKWAEPDGRAPGLGRRLL
jgi:hypothetical protein